MFILFLIGIAFVLTRDFSKIYALSSVLPVSIRREWIRLVHTGDYSEWEFYHSLLQREFPYYKWLSPDRKAEFIVRLIDIKNNMIFEAREGLELDQRKLTLLSASMVQLTFGFKDYRLFHFEKIIVFPEIFYSKLLDQNVKGLTYGTGFVYLSWRHFQEGYEYPENAINLGLHEFAHALMIQKPRHFETFTYNTFTRMANYLMKELQETGESNPLFRDYGLSNHAEFWAVCTEVFFEQPVEFRDMYPNLYKVTCRLLKQDTAELLIQYKRGATLEETFFRE